MGTRNLTIVRINGKVKVAQYCQWDGYPAGQGTIIAKFLQEKLNLRKLKTKVSKLKFVTDDYVTEKWNELEATHTKDVSTKFKEQYPELHRDTGGHILELIQDGVYEIQKFKVNFESFSVVKNGFKVENVVNSIDFLKDSLFCEWAYELDLDKKTVKVYKGFQKLKNKEEYGKCKVIKTYKFKDFTVQAMKDLEKELSNGK